MLSILIPCRDEEENLRLFPRTLFPILKKIGAEREVILVDDGSRDGSWREIEKLRADYPGVIAKRHPRNLGLGAALRTGFPLCQGEWIAVLDADLTFSPADIPRLIERQKRTGADMVSGSPFLAPAPRGTWRRRVPSRIINSIYRALLNRGLTSYTPMFRLYRTQALRQVRLDSQGFEVNAEIAAAFLRAGYQIAESPVVLTARAYGRSKLSVWRELKKHARLMLRILSRKI